MDRLHHTDLTARIDLPSAVHQAEAGRSTSSLRTLSAATIEKIGLAGFICCAAAVIVTATLLALHIH